MRQDIWKGKLVIKTDEAGEEVILSNIFFQCTKCELIKPAHTFGHVLRRMHPDANEWRNQAQCVACRSKQAVDENQLGLKL